MSNAAYHGGAKLSRQQAKVVPEEFPFRQIVPGRSEGTRPMAGRRGAPELHKFECGLQTSSDQGRRRQAAHA
jgi:hypothetical protein